MPHTPARPAANHPVATHPLAAALVAAPLLILALAACGPKVGTQAWCDKLQEKPKGDWTANEAADFLKHCVVPGTRNPD